MGQNHVGEHSTVFLVITGLLGLFAWRTSPDATYETVDLVVVRVRTALMVCALVSLSAGLWLRFFV